MIFDTLLIFLMLGFLNIVGVGGVSGPCTDLCLVRYGARPASVESELDLLWARKGVPCFEMELDLLCATNGPACFE